MSYVDHLKKFEPMDAYILFLLGITEAPGPFSARTVAKICHVSFKTVYTTIKRHQKTYDEYIKGSK